ncbi:thiamine S protein [Thalassoporum mexicanum PCC 7367]|uniref:MoaD/ThiS family protein n=1 Tax=Thalassoporum mexicanum TaxID=3457544 RepID=UPI00029FD7E2|nr:MoaD/ThiS family protein [Pseudanabaena sp. PCC 7367]AFY71225.1 thiamine S protein [Pseudanabaena sp. PCC 7367]
MSNPDLTVTEIAVTVKLFAAFQETIAAEQIELNLPARSPVVAVFDYLVQDYPELEKWRSHTRFAINLDFAPPDTELQDGDEVALIPPVSGG